ncbi:PAS domain S-box-containing protein/diguanylate cyclase (GGDEF) domain-containing protein [Modicisalibacter muralis]|uniref:PAS domain S-box-containing protein/diguanylate cyclase (GGDEF) domain-containing protein n=1 Tax=Modicisalibacter muralis TaxID=119000 RepID=A0A1G9N306_9GAMM|nr:EAL domain-containing protein [Halomonas muralis]SDL80890.1 PAS domain S-box-containing protein/diguanylate cyclase (GGDEF) domain-containing protein [Halomonas muralis]
MVDSDHFQRVSQARMLLAVIAISLVCLLLPGLPRLVISLLAATALLALVRVGYLLRWQSTGQAKILTLDNELQAAHWRQSERRFRALLESLPRVAVQGYDSQRKVIYWNEASTQLYGYTSEEAIGRNLEDLLIPEPMRDDVINAHTAWIREGREIPASELELRNKSGAPVAVFSHHVMLGEQSSDPLLFCVDVDLSDQKQARRDLDFMTHFDALTHLPNRRTFESELAECLIECQRHGDNLAVVFLDLDQFAEINDAQGYAQGDALLTLVARRLLCHQRSSDLIARFGSDEFVMAFPRVNVNHEALSLVNKLLDDFSQPFMLAGKETHVTASLGISLFPDNGTTASELIRNADVAKHRAKQAGRGSYWFFNQQFHDELIHQHQLAERLQNALRDGELALHYQPQVATRSGRIESLEALLRWFPRDGEAISPAEFIAVAERSNLIHRLGEWVINEACRQQAMWKAVGLGDCRIDINLSGKQIADHRVFLSLESRMAEYRLTPRDIGIELTENVLIQADDKTLEGLRRLYHQGMKIAIDDFGTGYSSLSYLKLFPVTSIKIDRSFVRDAPTDTSDRAIMEATVFIGHRLGLEVVAEGVENEDQLELVREMGCDLIQGYYFFRPMSSDDITKLLRTSEKGNVRPSN